MPTPGGHQLPVCAVLMPHAPVLVAPVGGARGKAAARSLRAMRAAAAVVSNHQPDTVVVLSPHAPRRHGAFGMWSDVRLRGSFCQFGQPEVLIDLPNDLRLVRAIADEARQGGQETWYIRHESLDHGALVPLWFLSQAGWTGPAVVLGLKYPGEGGLREVGCAVAAAGRALNRRVAIIASGDLSHRLTPGAPCGFHARAHEFDEAFIHLIGTGDYRELGRINPELRELAAEDAVDTTLIAAAAVNWNFTGHQLLNYEGPYGVGYGVAILFEQPQNGVSPETGIADDVQLTGALLPGLARQSVETALGGNSEMPAVPPGGYLTTRHGTFVTIRRRSGELRGCVGTVLPVHDNVVAETWHNARLAASKDARFAPIEADELSDLRFYVSVIHSLEKVASADDLDPRLHGVVVCTEDGRRGVLLPAIPGVETGEQQLAQARKKGRIDPLQTVEIWRFQVDWFAESG